MRTDEEFTGEVFSRMDRKSSETRSARKKLRILAVAAVAVAIALAVTGVALLTGPKDPSAVSSGGDEISSDIVIFSPDDSGENIDADIYRPAGYNENIGTVLSLKLEYSKEAGEQFDVLLTSVDKNASVEELIANANEQLDEKVDASSLKEARVDSYIKTGGENAYLSNLTRTQIFALAASGVSLQYVGSGKTSSDEIGFDSPEGISNYCELKGDNLIVSRPEQDSVNSVGN